MKSDNMGNRRFKDLLEASMKSKDTEEWLDVHFTRPIGLFFALIWERLGVHPNTITIISIFLGLQPRDGCSTTRARSTISWASCC